MIFIFSTHSLIENQRIKLKKIGIKKSKTN